MLQCSTDLGMDMHDRFNRFPTPDDSLFRCRQGVLFEIALERIPVQSRVRSGRSIIVCTDSSPLQRRSAPQPQ